MNLKEIKDIIKLMNENTLTEFELEKEGIRIHLKKQGVAESAQPYLVSAGPAQAAPAASASPAPAAPSPAKNFLEIKSPMVGTFYRSPSPESAPFIEVGAAIEQGQVVCIIEAMKLMNEIKSEVRGKVVEVLVDNAEPVEFGQTLFLVEPV